MVAILRFTQIQTTFGAATPGKSHALYGLKQNAEVGIDFASL